METEGSIYDLFYAVKYDQINKVKELVNNQNVTAIHHHQSLLQAVFMNSTEDRDAIAKYLVDTGVDVNKQDKDGNTALHYCPEWDALFIAQYILSHEGKPSLKLSDKFGNQPLWVAMFESKEDKKIGFSELYLSNDANIEHKNDFGLTPLDAIEKKQDTQTVRDPNSAEKLSWDKTRPQEEQWQMSERRGFNYDALHEDYMRGKISESQFLAIYHNPDLYRPESVKAKNP